MKVMLDTNVLISALTSGTGTCADVLRAVLATHRLAVGSNDILDEPQTELRTLSPRQFLERQDRHA